MQMLLHLTYLFQVQRDSSRHKKSTRAVSMQARYYNDSLMIHTGCPKKNYPSEIS